MSREDFVILVVGRSGQDAENLKRLIEFMDTPRVCAAKISNWRESLDGLRLEAMFVGPDLTSDEVDTLVAEVGEFDPNVSIVLPETEKVT